MSKQYNWDLSSYYELTDKELLEWFDTLCEINTSEAEEWRAYLERNKHN